MDLEILGELGSQGFEDLFFETLVASERFSDVARDVKIAGTSYDVSAYDNHKKAQTFFVLKLAPTVHPDLVSSVSELLSPILSLHPKAKLVLVTPGLGTTAANKLAAKMGIGIWGKFSLATLIDPADVSKALTMALTSPQKSTDFSSRLGDIPPGREHALEYQHLVADIFTYLFSPPLTFPKFEHSDAERRNRRDLILENSATDGVWRFLRERYFADYVVVDAKNYSTPIKKHPVLDIAHYLKAHGVGLFGVLVTRIGAAVGARAAIREHWITSGKMIVVLDDESLNAMLELKDNGGEPTSILSREIADFRLGL